jgi:hypothetical protein
LHVNLFAFDVDGTLDVCGSLGPVAVEDLYELKRLGHIVGIVGNEGKAREQGVLGLDFYHWGHKDAQLYLLQRGVIRTVTGYANSTHLSTSLSTYSLDPFHVANLMNRSFIGLPKNAPCGAIAFSEVFAHSFRTDPVVTVEENSGPT